MVSRVKSVSYYGIEAQDITVEAQISPGVPSFSIVGLPDKAVAESRERVKSALYGLRLTFPNKKVTVNLAPANLLKEGSHFDLPIAVGIMIEMGILPCDSVFNYIMIGELSLNGDLNAVNGTLPASIFATGKDLGIICPKANYEEAYWSGNNNIIPVEALFDVVNYLKGTTMPPVPTPPSSKKINSSCDLADVKGQKIAKRALEIAAAGGHNMLMIGPPGSGKSMLAKRINTILPPLSTEEILEINTIHSIAGYSQKGGIITERPFREPHSSSSMAAMVGGGKFVKPGEITLAHNGVLFMDELPEYNTNVLDSLRQPLESGEITIARVHSHVAYPANFQLIAAMNPCKCGYFGDSAAECKKTPKCAENYQSKISGPLIDRFDLQIELSAFNPFDRNFGKTTEDEEKSSEVASRVLRARELQAKRSNRFNKNISNTILNKQLEGRALSECVHLDGKSAKLLKDASEKFRLSMRGINRIMRVSRTVADLDGAHEVEYKHVLEAISYRTLKLKF